MKHKELAEQAGIGYLYEYEMKWAWLGELEHFAELVRADEREACAKIALKYEPTERQPYVTYAADEIRSRGKK
jgi:hypothetical protein